MSRSACLALVTLLALACAESEPTEEAAPVSATPSTSADASVDFDVIPEDEEPARDTSRTLPRFSTPQNVPCADQARTVPELIEAYEAGSTPGGEELADSWVMIGSFGSAPSLNCDGVTRVDVFEVVFFLRGDSIEIDMIGMWPQTTATTLSDEAGLTFRVDFGGDGYPEYRCRLTQTETLACLMGRGEWIRGWELKRRPVDESQLYSEYLGR